MRYKACKEAWLKIPVIVADNLTEEQESFLLKTMYQVENRIGIF